MPKLFIHQHDRVLHKNSLHIEYCPSDAVLTSFLKIKFLETGILSKIYKLLLGKENFINMRVDSLHRCYTVKQSDLYDWMEKSLPYVQGERKQTWIEQQISNIRAGISIEKILEDVHQGPASSLSPPLPPSKIVVQETKEKSSKSFTGTLLITEEPTTPPNIDAGLKRKEPQRRHTVPCSASELAVLTTASPLPIAQRDRDVKDSSSPQEDLVLRKKQPSVLSTQFSDPDLAPIAKGNLETQLQQLFNWDVDYTTFSKIIYASEFSDQYSNRLVLRKLVYEPIIDEYLKRIFDIYPALNHPIYLPALKATALMLAIKTSSEQAIFLADFLNVTMLAYKNKSNQLLACIQAIFPIEDLEKLSTVYSPHEYPTIIKTVLLPLLQERELALLHALKFDISLPNLNALGE